MNYRELMDVFSRCGMGAILVADNNMILDINRAGTDMLHVDEAARGCQLEQIAPYLCDVENRTDYGNPAFNEYLLPSASLELADLPPSTHLIVFRNATSEYRCGLLETALDHVQEAITLWDDECRMLVINEAATKVESHVDADTIGHHVHSLYKARGGTQFAVPYVIEKKKPLLNLRQEFVTTMGKDMQIVSNNYPFMKDGRVLGVAALMDDYTKMDALNKKIIDLQSKLMNRPRTQSDNENVLTARYHFDDIVFSGDAMRYAVDCCKQVAHSDAPVMIYGETGTGKELFAQSIHNASDRANGPFLAVNCAAIPTTLLESILFGTEKGAYTGADRREGLFEQADTGTLLLDEINSMDVYLQSKLLRVLQEGSFRRVGGSKLIHVDVRVISNINISPLEAMEQGLLRKDLYYRLGVINIKIPPLRQRKEDIPLLCKAFIAEKNKKLLKNATTLSPMTAELFHSYDWPGNVRELGHAIEYALNIIPEEKDVITPEYIPEHILVAVHGENAVHMEKTETPTLESILQDAGYRFLNDALCEHDGNISQTAKALGITRQNLQHRMKKFGVRAKSSVEAGGQEMQAETT